MPRRDGMNHSARARVLVVAWEETAETGWEEAGWDPEVAVCARPAEQAYPTREEFPATTWYVPNAAPKWQESEMSIDVSEIAEGNVPVYSYRCKNCDAVFDLLVGVVADDQEPRCVKCSSDDLEKLLTTFGVGSDRSNSGSCTTPT